MKEFTALKSSKLQTWIAVGGYDFSDKGKTHTTWSDMCSTQAGRAAFIQSTISFMDEYGFQGLVSLLYYQTATEYDADQFRISTGNIQSRQIAVENLQTPLILCFWSKSCAKPTEQSMASV
jgi:hypothetical protein